MLKELPKNLPNHKGNGKILRLKEGYNPNSSSLGSIVFSFPAALLAVPVLFATVAAFIATKFTESDKHDEDDDDEV